MPKDGTPKERKPRTLAMAYALWAVGFHYAYLGDRNRQILYLATLGGLGVWALRDAIRMRYMVEIRNQGGRLARPLYATGKAPSPISRLMGTLRQPAPERWVALDFETATKDPASVCEIGYAVLESGRVTQSASWRVKPPGNRYAPENVAIHGIGPEDTATALSMADTWPSVLAVIGDSPVLLHWSKFDLGLLRACGEAFGLAVPAFEYADTVAMAKMAFPGMPSHRLPLLAAAFGIPLDHHGAASDAAAVASVAERCRRAAGAPSLSAAVACLLGGTSSFEAGRPAEGLGGDNLVPPPAIRSIGRLAAATRMPGVALLTDGESFWLDATGGRVVVAKGVVEGLLARGLVERD